ncbi:MAG: hypothetical protein WC678_00195 [Parcubacteria group bacterium]
MAEETKRGGVLGKIIIFVIIVAIAVAGFVFFGKNRNTSSIVDAGKYQAVFLTNGQTYFGKVSNEKSAYVSLSDVYYLVLKRPLQNQQQDGEQPQEQPKSEYSLVKLGKEMHGPISMSINKDQILFIENLADDSKVVSTIKNQK